MMFWRVLWRLVRASRGPLALALLAVVSGAAVSAALLTLDLDAGEKLTREFRTLGANVIISPQQESDAAAVMDAGVLQRLNALHLPEVLAAAPYLYLSAEAVPSGQPAQTRAQNTLPAPAGVPVIVAGTWMDQVARMSAWWKVEGRFFERDDQQHCMVGAQAARLLGVSPGSKIVLHYAGREASLTVAGVMISGGAEDDQIFVSVSVAQALSGLTDRVGLVQMSVKGSASVIEGVMRRLEAAFPQFEIRPVRQLAAADGLLFERIRGLLFVTVFFILVLTALGVLAAMAGLALERRRDVGLMKALGGTVRRVMRFFLVEATALGAAGGIIGCALGIFLAEWIGQRVFATTVTPRWAVWPATVALMIAVALAGSLPLRLLGRVRPAEILRGE